MNNESKVNVLLVQYNPKYKAISENIKFISNLLSKYTKEDKIDLIVFPEMTLSGYIFDNADDIMPYTSPYNSGETFEFCSSLARKLECYIFMGYPEKTEDNKLYNSCMIINRKGEALPSYHKHFLYKDDKTWCLEGDKFGYLEITTHQGKNIKLGIGICMDINPYEFEAPFDKMEFANHCIDKDVDLIVFLTNWTDSEPEKQDEDAIYDQLNYWAVRLSPFYKSNIKKPVYFLAADRTGKEKDTSFIGCSCILLLTPKPKVLQLFDRKKQGVIYGSLPI